ncbi:MAG TPA: hypothetical protein VFR35_05355 [Actinoplanes sp.]|nr:hypothetical protein [Actinoplanes sp.]
MLPWPQIPAALLLPLSRGPRRVVAAGRELPVPLLDFPTRPPVRAL